MNISTEQLKVWLADIEGEWAPTPDGLSPSFPLYYDSEYGETVEALLRSLKAARWALAGMVCDCEKE